MDTVSKWSYLDIAVIRLNWGERESAWTGLVTSRRMTVQNSVAVVIELNGDS